MLVILDVVIGIVFVYLLLALLVTGINEWVAQMFATRAKILRRAITRLVEAAERPAEREGKVETPPQPEPPGERTRKFYEHPQIAALADGKNPPSYIPRETFAAVVRDFGWDAAPEDRAAHGLVAPVAMAQVSEGDAKAPVDPLQKLFDDTMLRATGWYKRRVQITTVVIGAVVVIAGNADTLQLANILWSSPTLRASVVQQATQAAQSGSAIERRVRDARYPTTDPTPADDEVSAEDQEEPPSAGGAASLAVCGDANDPNCQILQRLIGWGPDYKALNTTYCAQIQAHRDQVCAGASTDPECQKALDAIATEPRCASAGGQLQATAAFPGVAFLSSTLGALVVGHLFGWLLTLAAISLGAPFWFDMLKSLMNIRNAGRSPEDKEAADKKADTRPPDTAVPVTHQGGA